jgi:OOP family OmpA-OmpF porin
MRDRAAVVALSALLSACASERVMHVDAFLAPVEDDTKILDGDYQSPGPNAVDGLRDVEGTPAALPEGVAFATAVVSYEPGAPAPIADASHPEGALGAPDYTVDRHAVPGAVSLGNGGTLVLRFDGAGLGDGPGPDLFVFEVGAREEIELAVSDDGRTWRGVGTAAGGACAVDIAPWVREGESFHYVRLRDVPGQGPASAGFPGADIDAVGVRPGSLYKIIVPSAVLFAFDDDHLSGDAPAALEQVLDAIRSRSTARVSVEGHTDDVGEARYNLGLSVRRAEAVARYLEGRGVAKARITARGFGATRPLEQNDTEDHRARNRRVEVAIDARER